MGNRRRSACDLWSPNLRVRVHDLPDACAPAPELATLKLGFLELDLLDPGMCTGGEKVAFRSGQVFGGDHSRLAVGQTARCVRRWPWRRSPERELRRARLSFASRPAWRLRAHRRNRRPFPGASRWSGRLERHYRPMIAPRLRVADGALRYESSGRWPASVEPRARESARSSPVAPYRGGPRILASM